MLVFVVCFWGFFYNYLFLSKSFYSYIPLNLYLYHLLFIDHFAHIFILLSDISSRVQCCSVWNGLNFRGKNVLGVLLSFHLMPVFLNGCAVADCSAGMKGLIVIQKQ